MNDQRFDDDSLASGLRALAEDLGRQDAPPEIEQKLREAFRARAVATTVSKSYTPYWLTAIAAVLLIVIGVVALRMRDDQPPQMNAVQTEPAPVKPSPIKEEPQPRQVEEEPQSVAQPTPRRRSVRRHPRSEVANHVTREVATDFMPLGYLNAAALQDGGQIVRVELPRSALVNFGLPVNMDRYNEKVKADVLLGVDGMAHAIRFVQ
ncbi:MAG TPA: hypothetical protein VJT15_09180 [Pyrinomonadaceae bacterium]|nr:hypothetical protein [Pyrinomonadaceae bacterium]